MISPSDDAHCSMTKMNHHTSSSYCVISLLKSQAGQKVVQWVDDDDNDDLRTSTPNEMIEKGLDDNNRDIFINLLLLVSERGKRMKTRKSFQSEHTKLTKRKAEKGRRLTVRRWRVLPPRIILILKLPTTANKVHSVDLYSLNGKNQFSFLLPLLAFWRRNFPFSCPVVKSSFYHHWESRFIDKVEQTTVERRTRSVGNKRFLIKHCEELKSR